MLDIASRSRKDEFKSAKDVTLQELVNIFIDYFFLRN
jgi:hypothetical protein